MQRTAISALTLAALFAFAGCATDSGEDSDQAAADKTGADTSASSESSTHDAEPTGSADTDGDGSDDANTDALTLRVSGDETTIEPTDVYCSGSEGNIHHIIGKTNDGLPLVKAEDTHFAMVKTSHQRPYKAESPSGIDYGKDRVTFDDTSLGSATLNGTMVCTEWED